MIERTTVNDRPATVVYIKGKMQPADKEDATLIKVLFDDGECLFLTPPPEGRQARTLLRDWDESKHPREPAGSPEGGEFASGGGNGGGESSKDTVKLDPAVVDVGGDAWNRETAVRLEREYQHVKPDLEKIVADQLRKDEPVSQEEINEDDEEAPIIPESWDEIGNTQQEEFKTAWMENTKQEFLNSEISNWQDNGDAMEDTKSQLAYHFHSGAMETAEYVKDALDELIEERREEREAEIPFSNEQLMDAMKFEYDAGSGKDVEITWDDDELGKPVGWVEEPTLPGIEPIKPSGRLTQEMRGAIEAKVIKAFNDEADKKVSDAEPPEYLSESAEEYQDQYWDGMSDKEKFSKIEDLGLIEKPDKKTAEVTALSRLPDKFDPLGERDTTQDYKLTKLLGAHMSVERSADVLMQRGIFETRNAALRAAHTFENRLWTAWKGDSASTDGLILQAATAAELGGRFRPAKPDPDTVIGMTRLQKDADERFGSAGGWDGVKAYIRAKWETSQYLLDKANKPTVDVYRGILLKEKGKEQPVEAKSPDYPLPLHYTKLPEIVLHRNGAQSTTTDPYVANKWRGIGALAKGFDSDKDRVVFRMQTPRTAVLSLPAYGQNMMSEHEVILAGTAWKKWDAWHDRAPTFAQVPA